MTTFAFAARRSHQSFSRHDGLLCPFCVARATSQVENTSISFIKQRSDSITTESSEERGDFAALSCRVRQPCSWAINLTSMLHFVLTHSIHFWHRILPAEFFSKGSANPEESLHRIVLCCPERLGALVSADRRHPANFHVVLLCVWLKLDSPIRELSC